jgi:hypothetical protein
MHEAFREESVSSRRSKNHPEEASEAPDIETEKGRAEILKDMDATLRRMLETPPKPHNQMSHPRGRKQPDRRPRAKSK